MYSILTFENNLALYKSKGVFCVVSHLHKLKTVLLFVTVQDDIIGHTETLSDTQVIKQRRLADRVIHLHHNNI